MSSSEPSNFAQLFKKYRLLSQFTTLVSFSHALEDEGIFYDPSILSHWQNGTRQPSERAIALVLLKIFIQRKSISSPAAANELLESLDMGHLTSLENSDFFPNSSNKTYQLPILPAFYVERNFSQLDNIQSINGKIIHIFGLAGSGKTSSAIQIAKQYEKYFPDGLIWLQISTTSLDEALNHIAFSLNENISEIKNLHLKAASIRSYLSNKRALLIFDNAENLKNIDLLIPYQSQSTVIITSTFKGLTPFANLIEIQLDSFTELQTEQLYIKSLVENYYQNNKTDLEKLSSYLAHLPLAIHLTAIQLRNNIFSSKEILDLYKKQKLPLTQYKYYDTNLSQAINVTIEYLDPPSRQLLQELSVFGNNYFSIESIRGFDQTNIFAIKNQIEQLLQRCLIQAYPEDKFKLHPVIALYCTQNFSIDTKLLERIVHYYIKLISDGISYLNKQPSGIDKELNCILHILDTAIQNSLYTSAIALWERISIYLWTTGRWEVLDKYGDRIVSVCKMINDHKSAALLLIRERSWIYYWRGNVETAEEKALEGLSLAQQLEDEYLIAFAEQRLGVFYITKGSLNRAAQLLESSFQILLRLKKTSHLIDGNTYFGHLYTNKGQYSEAIEYYKKSLELAEQENDYKAQAISYTYLSRCFYELKEYSLCSENLEKSLKMNSFIGSKIGIAFYYIGKAKLQLALKETASAKDLLDKARKLCQELELNNSLQEIELLESNL